MAAVGRHLTTCLVVRKLNSASTFNCILAAWRDFNPKSTAGRNTVHVVPCERHVTAVTAYGRQYCDSRSNAIWTAVLRAATRTTFTAVKRGIWAFLSKHSDQGVAFDPEIFLACASPHGTLIWGWSEKFPTSTWRWQHSSMKASKCSCGSFDSYSLKFQPIWTRSF